MPFDWTPHKGGNYEFVKFANIGDGVTGTIVNIRVRTFDPAKGEVVCLDINNGGDEPVTMTADKVDLRPKIADLEPQIGDRIRVKFIGEQKIPGSPNPMKIFTVEVRRGDVGVTPVPSGMVPVGPAPYPEAPVPPHAQPAPEPWPDGPGAEQYSGEPF